MEILYPMFGMIVLSGIILVIFASTRVPGIYKMWGKLQFAKYSADLHPKLPEKARYLTDNYNHIFEQPTLFYAITVYIFLIGNTDTANIFLAWFYVVTRIIHSAIQITVNNVSWRATIFGIGSLILVLMILKEILFFL
mgnify:FL=1